MDAKEVEQLLLSRRLPGVLPEEGWVLPHYDGLSIANLPATMAVLLGASPGDGLGPLPDELWNGWAPGLRRIVLVVLDGLGYRLLQRRWSAGDGATLKGLATAGQMVPLTSVFPSTTDAALCSLATGLPPAAHGWLAYEMYLREIGMAVNAILLCPVWAREQDMLLEWGVQPEALLPARTAAERLAGQGVTTVAVLPKWFQNSGFTRMLYRGVGRIEHHFLASDFWLHVRRALADTRGRRALIHAYWAGLDTVGHAYGPTTDAYDGELRAVDALLRDEFLTRLPAEDRAGTLLLITADHGQLRIPPSHILTANEDATLSAHLQVPIVGESRAAFVYPRPGRAQAIREYLETSFPGRFAIYDSAELLEAGLMGRPVSDEARARAGELLVLPLGDHALQRARPRTALVGRHGGLTAREMLVPLIGVRLDALGG